MKYFNSYGVSDSTASSGIGSTQAGGNTAKIPKESKPAATFEQLESDYRKALDLYEKNDLKGAKEILTKLLKILSKTPITNEATKDLAERMIVSYCKISVYLKNVEIFSKNPKADPEAVSKSVAYSPLTDGPISSKLGIGPGTSVKTLVNLALALTARSDTKGLSALGHYFKYERPTDDYSATIAKPQPRPNK